MSTYSSQTVVAYLRSSRALQEQDAALTNDALLTRDHTDSTPPPVSTYIWLLGGTFILLLLMCMRPRRKSGGDAQRARDRVREEARIQAIKTDPERRVRFLKNSLITKRFDDLDYDTNVCAVCLGTSATDDVVTWSKGCRHVFHQECLHGWLAKHDDCPSCRCQIIHDDGRDEADDIEASVCINWRRKDTISFPGLDF